MKNKYTIGIPAYNEEGNILNLLNSLVQQKNNYKLDNIIVVSDGSTDSTNKILLSIKNKKLKLVINKKRRGIAAVQNQIASITESDFLVLLDADTLPANNSLIEKLIKPLVKNTNVGLTGAKTESLPGENIFEKSISNSHEMKNEIYMNIKNKNNLYLCHGRARAFSKEVYKNIKWPESSPEDAYSYLFTKKIGKKFTFCPGAVIKFKSPNNLLDHKKQSERFSEGIKTLYQEFSKDVVEKEYKISKIIIFKKLTKYLIIHPFLTMNYIFIQLRIKFSRDKINQDLSKWNIADSSKNLSI